ncbi:MAG: peptidoglycan bridge formation glycyltransferase FemA/FemB family protein [Anaerolineae bacterium]|nr:peptidoglycan bridge formation glycyltransferase FemA/FemB family protein [Anaerolineae bacterium]
MILSITIRTATTDADRSAWNSMILSGNYGSFYITTSWLNAYTAFGMSTQYLLAEDSQRNLVGGAALVIYRIGPLSWLYVPHGPISVHSDDAVVDALLDAIETRSRKMRAAFIQISPFERSTFDQRWQVIADENSIPYAPDRPKLASHRVSDHLLKRGYTQRSLYKLLAAPNNGQIVDLGAEDLLSTFRKRTSDYIRRTQNSTIVSIRQVATLDDLHLAYNLIRGNTERYGSIYRPWETFKSATWEGIQEGYMLVMLAFLSEIPVSAILVGFGGNIGSYISGGTERDADFEGLRPAYLLHYLAMLETKKRGYGEYDLTAIVGDGVAQLKRGFRPSYYRLQEPFSLVRNPTMFRIYKLVNDNLMSNRARMRLIANLIHAGKSILRRK